MANKINGEHYPHLDYPVHNVFFFCFICHGFFVWSRMYLLADLTSAVGRSIIHICQWRFVCPEFTNTPDFNSWLIHGEH